MELLAAEYAHRYHFGQRRKNGHPYIIHPQRVVENLRRWGEQDNEVLAIGWLHDTLEDTTITYELIQKEFGTRVAEGVLTLSRNVDRAAYVERILLADPCVQRVKIADLRDNLTDLEMLPPLGIEHKLQESHQFYIPLAKKVCPQAALELQELIGRYYTLFCNVH